MELKWTNILIPTTSKTPIYGTRENVKYAIA